MIEIAGISNVDVVPRLLNAKNVESPSRKKTSSLITSIEFCTRINPGHVEITLPLRTLSPNQNEPWRKRHAREKDQRRAVMFAMIAVKEKIQLLDVPERSGIFHLKFTRYAPKFLDAWDNLPFSFKKILDQTCAEILCDYVPGRADGAGCFRFEYDQVKTKGKVYGVKIEIRY